MKIQLILILTVILFSCGNKKTRIEVKSASTQLTIKLNDSTFDRNEFDRKFETVRWLCKYDEIAWVTSDEIQKNHQELMKDLGKEWFCFEDTKNNWHALYGKFENNNYRPVIHFIVDSSNQSKLSLEEIDTLILNSYGRAIYNANNLFSKVKDTLMANVGFNQFIRQNADNTLTVYILPAIQQDNIAVYGGEFIYTFDSFGSKLKKDDSYFQGNFRGYKTGSEEKAVLNYSEFNNPTLGSIFFTWYFKDYFPEVVLNSRKARSCPFKHQEDNSYYWFHAFIDENIEKK